MSDDPKDVWTEAIDQAAERKRRADELAALIGEATIAHDRGDGPRPEVQETGHPTPDSVYARMQPPPAAQPLPSVEERLRDAVNACAEVSMDYAALIVRVGRMRRELDQAKARLDAERKRREEAVRLVGYALQLRMHGENAPGGNETWKAFEAKAEEFLRSVDQPDSVMIENGGS